MRRTFAAAAVALGLAALTSGDVARADTTPGPRSIGVRLLDAPVDRKDDPRALSYIVDHVAPGTTIQRHVEVSSTGPGFAEVSVYPAAAVVAGDGFVGQEGATANELSSWTRLDRSTLTLRQGAHQSVAVTISVPADAAPGERYAVLWAQVGSPDGAAGITEVSRVGIRIYLSVGGNNEPASDFTIETLTASRTADGRPLITAQVHNTGGRALDLGGTLSLSGGPAGLSAGPFTTQSATTLAVGAVGPVLVSLDPSLPPGPWTAAVTLRSGLLTRTAQASVTFPAAGTAQPAPALAGSTPWTPIILSAAVLVAVALLLWFFLSRARATPGRHARRTS